MVDKVDIPKAAEDIKKTEKGNNGLQSASELFHKDFVQAVNAGQTPSSFRSGMVDRLGENKVQQLELTYLNTGNHSQMFEHSTGWGGGDSGIKGGSLAGFDASRDRTNNNTTIRDHGEVAFRKEIQARVLDDYNQGRFPDVHWNIDSNDLQKRIDVLGDQSKRESTKINSAAEMTTRRTEAEKTADARTFVENVGALKQADLGLQKFGDTLSKSAVDSRLADLRSPDKTMTTQSEFKEMKALEALSKNWNDIAHGNDRVSESAIQSWAKDHGQIFPGFNPTKNLTDALTSVPLKDLGIDKPGDPISKFAVDSSFARLSRMPLTSMSEDQKKEMNALGLVRDKWTELGYGENKKSLSLADIQGWAARSGSSFKDFNYPQSMRDAADLSALPTTYGTNDKLPQTLDDALSAARQRVDVSLSRNMSPYAAAEAEMKAAGLSTDNSKQVRQHLAEMADRSGWIKTDNDRHHWDAYVKDGKTSHLPRTLNGKNLINGPEWDHVPSDERERRLHDALESRTPRLSADLSKLNLTPDQLKDLRGTGPSLEWAGRAIAANPDSAIQFFAERHPLTAEQQQALRQEHERTEKAREEEIRLRRLYIAHQQDQVR